MGGVIKGAKKTISNVVPATKRVFTGKGNLRDLQMMATSDLGNQIYDSTLKKKTDAPGPPVDPLDFNAEQAAGDMAGINAEGMKQYDESLAGINEYGKAANQRAKDLFGEMLPDIAENSQAAHLYDSTGYGSEVARQQSSIASQIAEQEAAQRLAALDARHGFQTGAIQRGMSLQDFTNQARVAKAIGATVAPQAPSSKATGMSGGIAGAGSGATIGTSIAPGYGTAIGALLGGAAGYMGGSSANKRGSGK